MRDALEAVSIGDGMIIETRRPQYEGEFDFTRSPTIDQLGTVPRLKIGPEFSARKTRLGWQGASDRKFFKWAMRVAFGRFLEKVHLVGGFPRMEGQPIGASG